MAPLFDSAHQVLQCSSFFLPAGFGFLSGGYENSMVFELSFPPPHRSSFLDRRQSYHTLCQKEPTFPLLKSPNCDDSGRRSFPHSKGLLSSYPRSSSWIILNYMLFEVNYTLDIMSSKSNEHQSLWTLFRRWDTSDFDFPLNLRCIFCKKYEGMSLGPLHVLCQLHICT